MAELIQGIRAAAVRENLSRVNAEIAATGRAPGSVQILAATKYVARDDLDALAEAGVRLVGENRLQDLLAKQQAHRELFAWDFIGHLQSRKVRELIGHVRYIHSVSTESALTALRRHAPPDTEMLVEVNVAREDGKSGITPEELPAFLERAPVRVVGLMTMPPLTSDPEASRPHFAALGELARRHGLAELSMGTSQDYLVAVQEGATIIRLGRTLYEPGSPSSP